MRISVFTMVGNTKETPTERGDAWIEAINSYAFFADEIVIVDGSGRLNTNVLNAPVREKCRVIADPWEYDWSWMELPKKLNTGYKNCTGDWCIKADIDYIFHEKDAERIHDDLSKIQTLAASLRKFSFVLHNKFYEKGGVPIAINKRKAGNKVGFGRDKDRKTDLCYPIIRDGTKDSAGVPLGRLLENEVTRTSIPIYNYDYSFKTQEQTKKEFHRFSKAYTRYFRSSPFGSTASESFDVFIEMMKGRLSKCPYTADISDHPIFIRDRIKNLKPSEFAYDGWGLLN